MLAGSPAQQWAWHEAHRDLAKNMYRTSYADMAHGRECHVRSDFPEGYGGHVPSVRHDLLHRNTAIDRHLALRRADPSRDAFPSFLMQKEGLPSVTAFPCGAKKNPTKGVVPHSGSTTDPRPPWALLASNVPPLNHRNVPATLRRNASAPSLVGAGAQVVEQKQERRRMFMESPTADGLKRTVLNANAEAAKAYMPTELEVLAGEKLRSL